MARIGTNMRVEIESGLGAELNITALTKADPGVATLTAHGLSSGDIIKFVVASGMVELDGQAVRVSVVDPNTFQLEDLNTSGYSTWISSASNNYAKEVTTFATMACATNVTMPNPQPNKIDTTRLIDKTKQYQYGLSEAPDGNIATQYDPADAAVVIIKAATRSNTDKVMRITWAGAQTTIANANWAGGEGFDLQQNQVATSTIPFTPIGVVMDYET